jgi:hypothetical protein
MDAIDELNSKWDESLYIWSKFKSEEDLSQKWKQAKSRPSALFPGRFRVQKNVKLKRVSGQRWFEYDGKKMVWVDKLHLVKPPSISKRIADTTTHLSLGREFAEHYLDTSVFVVGQPHERKSKLEEWIENFIKQDMEEHEKLVKVRNYISVSSALLPCPFAGNSLVLVPVSLVLVYTSRWRIDLNALSSN